MMLLGLIIRNLKSYETNHYVKVINNKPNNLSFYVGINGVGKSAVLEAIDSFFNQQDWNYTKGQKRDDVEISLVFAVEKSKIKKCQQKFNLISDFFWNIEANTKLNNTQYPHLQAFVSHKKEFESQFDRDKFSLILVGKEYTKQKIAYFAGFNNEVRTYISENNANTPSFKIDEYLEAFLEAVTHHYTYVYIPVEGYVQDFLKLERREIQDLMSKDIAQQIDSALTEKNIRNAQNKLTSVLDSINVSLDRFMGGINEKIKSIDSTYDYGVENNKKKNLTALDVREQILKAYFNIRSLKKDKKEIGEQSSGEQRKALIDVATAFLNNNELTEKEIILAIDEPEASMHTASCFDQFLRLIELSKRHQLLITTHWYGFLPMIQEGNLHHVEINEANDKRLPKHTTFDLKNYLEDRRKFPDDIELKSFFDFVSSILSMMKQAKYQNWIICEGSDDANYIKSHINESDIKNLRVLPVGGIGNVVKIYKYLYQPFKEKVESSALTGKILCMVDTDKQQLKLDLPSSEGSLAIKRLQFKNDIITLTQFDDVIYSATSIEDGALSQTFFEACRQIANDENNGEILETISKIKHTSIPSSSVFASASWAQALLGAEIGAFREFVTDNKPKISEHYFKHFKNTNNSDTLDWVNKIKEFFA